MFNRALPVLAALVLAGVTLQAAGQAAYPSKPIKVVVGYTAGGASDIMAREIARKLGEQMGQPAVVENRPGAASNIASDVVAKSAPDGYTILLGTIALSINSSLYAKLPYDPLKDLVPVSQVASTPFLLVATPGANISSVKELVQAARSSKDALDYATAGSGSGAHLFMEYFKLAAGVPMSHVPYNGTAPALTDLLGGRVPLTFDNIITTLPLVKAGKLKALAVSAKTRTPVAPEIPTLDESGVPGFDATAWFGLFVPAGTPPEIVNRLHAETVQALKDPKLRESFLKSGSEPVGSSPAQFSAFFRNEIDKWAKVVRSANLEAK